MLARVRQYARTVRVVCAHHAVAVASIAVLGVQYLPANRLPGRWASVAAGAVALASLAAKGLMPAGDAVAEVEHAEEWRVCGDKIKRPAEVVLPVDTTPPPPCPAPVAEPPPAPPPPNGLQSTHTMLLVLLGVPLKPKPKKRRKRK